MDENWNHQLYHQVSQSFGIYLKNLRGSCILFFGESKIFLAAMCRPQASHFGGLLVGVMACVYHRDQ